MECSCLKASWLHREPGLSWPVHPATPSQDSQCSLAGLFCSAHFPPALLSTFFTSHSSAHLRVPPPHPGQHKPFLQAERRLGLRSLVLRCCLPTEHCLSCSQLWEQSLSLCPPSLPWIGPAHHTLHSPPAKGLVQSQPGELRAACLFWVTSAHLPCFCYLKSLSLSLSLPLQMALQRPWECTAAPIMSPRFLVSCTLSRKVTGPDNIIYIAV